MMSERDKPAVTVALTGASGIAYGLRLVQCLSGKPKTQGAKPDSESGPESEPLPEGASQNPKPPADAEHLRGGRDRESYPGDCLAPSLAPRTSTKGDARHLPAVFGGSPEQDNGHEATQGVTTHLLISPAARAVAKHEDNSPLPEEAPDIHTYLTERLALNGDLLHVHDPEDWGSLLASGSSAPHRMVICPCSMGSLAAIAGSHSNNLIERAADVVIKERGRLIVVPRETPVSSTHLEHMLSLSRCGVTVLPASPAFYPGPNTIQEMIDYIVARILDHLAIEHHLSRRWGEP